MALLTGKSDVPINVKQHYDRNLLRNAVLQFVWDMSAQTRPVPLHAGDQIRFRRYEDLAVATSPLTDGVTPTGKQLITTDVTATIKQYGDFITVTDNLKLQGLDRNLMDISGGVLGRQAGKTMDILDREARVVGTSVRYSNGVSARTSIVTAIQDTDVQIAVRTLEGNEATPAIPMINGSQLVSTTPVRPSFFCIAPYEARQDLEALQGWTPAETYSSQTGVMPTEMGSAQGVRFVATPRPKIWADGGGSLGSTGLISTGGSQIDVYAFVFFGTDSFGKIPLSKDNIENVIKAMGSAGTDDPLNQRATSGWKAWHAAKILNDNFTARVEAGVTSLT